jgi:dolichol-phosphate mannosyltransferase
VTSFSIVFAAYILIRFITTDDFAPGFPSIALLIATFSGIQLLILGIIGEYMGRTLRETQRRPLYLVADRKGKLPTNVRSSYPLPPE